MKTHRIVTIGRDSYVLPESFSVEESLRLLNFLGGCKKIDDTSAYIADASSRYANTVMVLATDSFVEVAVKITAVPLLTRDEYEAVRAKGQAEYDAAHPALSPALSAA